MRSSAYAFGYNRSRAANTAPRTVQGIPYVPRDNSGIELMSDDWGDFPVPDGDFTFDMITNWTGEGENEAALVIQWNDDREKNALVFGYRWDGMATGADMIRAVVANNPRLYGLINIPTYRRPPTLTAVIPSTVLAGTSTMTAI